MLEKEGKAAAAAVFRTPRLKKIMNHCEVGIEGVRACVRAIMLYAEKRENNKQKLFPLPKRDL